MPELNKDENKKNILLKSSLLVIIIGFASRILGFGREVLLGNFFGASTETDLYLFSIMIPTIIFDVVGAAIAATFVPMYLDAKYKNDKDAQEYTNVIFTFIFIFAVVITIIGTAFSPFLVKVFAPEYTGEKLANAIVMMRLAFPLTIFLGMVYVFSAFLQALKVYIPPASIGIIYNIVLICGTIISYYYWGIVGLVVSHVLAIASQVFFLFIFAIKQGFKFEARLQLRSEVIKKMYHLSLPVIVGLGVIQINTLVDRSIASRLQEGSISSLYYANRVNFLFLGIFALSLITIMYPVLSELAVKRNFKKFNEHLIRILSIVAMFTIPITVIASIWNNEIIGVLFQRGAFNKEDTIMTAQSLSFYVIGLTTLAWREVISKAFYSLGNTKIPMYNSIITVILNIFLSIVLTKFMDFAGLALATSISSFLAVFLLFYHYLKRYGEKKYIKQLSLSIFKYLFASGFLGFILVIGLRCYYQLSDNSGNLSLVIVMITLLIAGFITYILILYIFKVEEVKSFLVLVKRKFSRGT